MPRYMSFALTTEQVADKTKTVTRRFGWWFLKPGDLVQPVEKAMGLKPGEKVRRIGGLIRIVSTRREPLNAIDDADCSKEGFPSLKPIGFVAMMRGHYGCEYTDEINRIEFEYI
jgi:hypothetical protein